jgi:hypothetical protein
MAMVARLARSGWQVCHREAPARSRVDTPIALFDAFSRGVLKIKVIEIASG